MTQPGVQRPQPAVAAHTAGWWLLIIAAVLFAIAAFAAGGDALGNIGAWTWAFGGFAAWCLSGAIP